MKITLASRPAAVVNGIGTFWLQVHFCIASLLFSSAILAQSTATTSAVTIVLPPEVVAGRPATLAVLDADGRLAPNVAVELEPDSRITTDRTGRATFMVPAAGTVLLAKASGNSAAALVDAPRPSPARPLAALVAPVVGLHDPFAICGAGFGGTADANLVRINGEFALILAASPECLVVLPPPHAAAGPAKLAVETPEAQATSISTPQAPIVRTPGPFTLVSLEFAPPSPPLEPGRKGRLAVLVGGSDQPLPIAVENETPGVLAFRRGDSQELRTTGGPHNVAGVEVHAIRSGDFSFHARVLPAPDVPTALRYLEAAAEIAPTSLRAALNGLSNRLAHHPDNAEKIRSQLQAIIVSTMPGDFRTLLDAAHSAL